MARRTRFGPALRGPALRGPALRGVVAAVTGIVLLASAAAAAVAETRVALVVGNGAYAHTTVLSNPANDAGDIAAAQEKSGFTVVKAIDVGRRDFDGALRRFTELLSGADVALFYYAGHGLQVGLQNYLVPVDAQLARERDLEFEAVSLAFVLRQMEIDREGKTTIVMLDACRDNPLARNLARSMGTRSTNVGRGLAPAATGLGTFIAYATQPGNVALDGTGRNSPFTAALLSHMGQRGRNLNATMIAVRKDVIAATDGRQVPWDHSAMTGEFFFVPADAATRQGTVAAAPAPQGAGIDLAALQRRLAELESDVKQREKDVARGRDEARASGGVPPVMPKAPPGSSAMFDLSENVRLEGTVIRTFRAPSPAACRDACERDTNCAGFQHGRKIGVMGQCELFAKVESRHEDNRWRSGVREAALATTVPVGAGEGKANRPADPVTRFERGSADWMRSRTFTFLTGHRTDGKALRTLQVASPSECLAACEAEKQCGAFHLAEAGGAAGTCKLVADPQAEVADRGWTTGLKEAEPARISLPPPVRNKLGFDFHERTLIFGEVIKSVDADTADGCMTVCRNTASCVAASYSEPTHIRPPGNCTALGWVKGTVSLSSATAIVRSK